MNIFMDDQAVARRVLDHIEKGTTDLAPGMWREPVEHYRSPERLAREIERVLRRAPTPFCPAAAIAAPGMYIARDAAGTPLVAIRGRDGEVRAFRNACRHRGMPVAIGSGKAMGFVCTYHGWTYGLDGRLRHIPDEHGFPGLDKGCHNLVPVGTRECSGLVFITQDEPSLGAESFTAVPDLIRPEQQLFDTSDREVEANWKIVLEGFLEGYHIRHTHRETFYPYGFDNLNVVEVYGRNSRVTFPFRRIAKLTEIAPENWRIDGLLTYVYHLFPNVLIAVFSHHTSVVVLEPVAVDRTREIVYSFTNRGSDGDPEAEKAAKRDSEFVRDAGLLEDRAVVCAIQRSLAARANDVFTFGRFEGAIAHFHRCLDAALEVGPVLMA